MVPVALTDRVVVTVLLHGLPDSESVGVTVTEIDQDDGVKVRVTVPVPVRVGLLEAVVLCVDVPEGVQVWLGLWLRVKLWVWVTNGVAVALHERVDADCDMREGLKVVVGGEAVVVYVSVTEVWVPEAEKVHEKVSDGVHVNEMVRRDGVEVRLWVLGVSVALWNAVPLGVRVAVHDGTLMEAVLGAVRVWVTVAVRLGVRVYTSLRVWEGETEA